MHPPSGQADCRKIHRTMFGGVVQQTCTPFAQSIRLMQRGRVLFSINFMQPFSNSPTSPTTTTTAVTVRADQTRASDKTCTLSGCSVVLS